MANGPHLKKFELIARKVLYFLWKYQDNRLCVKDVAKRLDLLFKSCSNEICSLRDLGYIELDIPNTDDNSYDNRKRIPKLTNLGVDFVEILVKKDFQIEDPQLEKIKEIITVP